MTKKIPKLLFFGSFNPIHIGHITMAEFSSKQLNISETLFVLSPQNPFKTKENLLSFDSRFDLLKEAKKDYPFINPCNIEKNLPQPNYTYQTIKKIKEKHSDFKLFFLIGSDNWNTFHLWKKYEQILQKTTIVIYPREQSFKNNPFLKDFEHNIVFLKDAPLFNISSSFVRKTIKENKVIHNLLSKKTYEKIKQLNLYKNKCFT
ncbi:MAG: nicotinate (nicotinamide) nucleotide adenylyltransferase [Chitinophagaceae bacterium]